ncbi:Facilitated trehalose transporter Tret1-2 homolog-like Protein [Tribolium castaneum]|uniref:Facilitated trehalose transporter Tret1-2 homolog-like Protein n=1 Tax=Tribolium castaneum TaxID=7070 RepID=D2A0M6_TRICA|nr:PREDICTED: facilitated trehalose transporter Tret1 [Tribolium castaneum]EFA01663.1 Facilitated trehalose transporter Tret1-2 homolog-like Protein [Tribolium castaneum]|eukprot:XP_967660.1 PREDICTED: facilitated trehalose transporter Tret1 [Tribolium castaneum]
MYKPTYFYQYLTTFTALLTILTGGMHYAWPSPSLPQLTSNNSSSLQITNDEGSWIIIMELISPIPSCFLGAFIVDLIGRKKAILLSAIPYFLSWLMIAFANSELTLGAARLLAGVSDGIAFTVIPLYIAEIADASIRGLLGAAISVSWISGMLFINVVGAYLSISTTALICSVFPILLVLTFIWMPESPYHLIMKHDIERARIALRKFKGRSDIEDELSRLQEAVKTQNQKNASVWDLFRKKNNQEGLRIVAIVRNAQQMSGVAAISFYTLSIFNEAGDFISPFTATVIYVSIQCFMTAVCSVLIDRTGRRPLLIASLIGSAISLFVLGTYFYIKDFTTIDISSFNFVPLLALLGYVIIFNIGAQPIPLLIQGELFPTNVKALASCFSEVYFCIIASMVSKLFQTLRDSFGMYLPFYGFAVCSAVNLVFVIFFVPETKGKTLEEIQATLGVKKSKSARKLVIAQ